MSPTLLSDNGALLISLVFAAFGVYGLYRIGGWHKPLIWIYFLFSPFYTVLLVEFLLFFSLDIPLPYEIAFPLCIFGGISLIHGTAAFFRFENPVTGKELFCIFLFCPLLAEIFDRYGWYLTGC